MLATQRTYIMDRATKFRNRKIPWLI